MNIPFIVFSLLVLLCSTDYGLAAISKKSPSSTSTKVSTTITTTTIKPADKTLYPKKVSALKKRPSKPTLKKLADITEKFKDLPADDLAFIKELDKQFKLHGGKVKIKVENDNATTTTKNSKRTIEGDLGYGYAHNGYDYSPPKYMFYPYSQNDIAHNAPKYFLPEGKTEVSIEPSYSYELKPQTYVEHQQIDVPQNEHQHGQVEEEQHHHHHVQQQQQQQYEEPVIVLRIPGPAKYASHLQTLLQQYLEIRAAQYLRILEETEQRQHQQHQHQQQHLQQVDYQQAPEQEQVHHVQQVPQQQSEVSHEHAEYHQQHQHLQYEPQQQQPEYPDINHVYQHYKHRHQSHQAVQHATQPEHTEQVYYVPQQAAVQHQQQQHHYVPQAEQQQQEQPQFYYTHQQEYAQPEGPPANTYQHIFLLSMAEHVQGGYEPEHGQLEAHQQQQHVYVPEPEEQQHYESHSSSSSPVLTENNPRSSHTKVIFTHNTEHAGTDYSNMYPLPSVKPNERLPAKSIPDYHQDYQMQPHPYNAQQESQETSQNYQQHEQVAPEATHQQPTQQVVAITQRPYNYHAHGVKPRARGRGGHKRRIQKSVKSVKDDDQDLQKIRDYVRENLGAQTGTEVEIKTTKVIEG